MEALDNFTVLNLAQNPTGASRYIYFFTLGWCSNLF